VLSFEFRTRLGAGILLRASQSLPRAENSEFRIPNSELSVLSLCGRTATFFLPPEVPVF